MKFLQANKIVPDGTRGHIWGYAVCLCPIKGTPGVNELSCPYKEHFEVCCPFPLLILLDLKSEYFFVKRITISLYLNFSNTYKKQNMSIYCSDMIRLLNTYLCPSFVSQILTPLSTDVLHSLSRPAKQTSVIISP